MRRTPMCHRHASPVRCLPAVVDLEYPGGTLPAEGYRCPRCGHELFDAEQVEQAQKRARELGLHGIERSSRRKLRQVGSSLSVTLDPELLRELFPHAKAGDEVEVGREGSRIVIRPVRAHSKRDRSAA